MAGITAWVYYMNEGSMETVGLYKHHLQSPLTYGDLSPMHEYLPNN